MPDPAAEAVYRRRLSNRALYQQIHGPPVRANSSLRRTYDLLRSCLHHSFEPGCHLVESELVDSLSSSRNTVRSALQRLAQEGLVTRGPKVGTTVRGSTILPFTDLLTTRDKELAYRMHDEGLETSIIPAPGLVRKWLHLPPGSSVAVMERLVYQDGTPVGLSIAYVGLTAEHVEQLGGRQPPDVISFLENDLNVRLGRCETTVAAVGCDAETASQLGIPEGSPMLWLEDFMSDEDGHPRAICQLRYRGDRLAFGGTASRPHAMA